jgi:hypothetical protein
MKPFEHLRLDTLRRTGRQAECYCFECGAKLPVDLGAAVKFLGPGATLAAAGYRLPCPVCEAAGLLLREMPRADYGSAMVPKPSHGLSVSSVSKHH